MIIKKGDKMLLFIKNLMNDKLNNLYIEAFRVENVRDVTTLLTLSNIKKISRFYMFMLKKTSSSTLLITI